MIARPVEILLVEDNPADVFLLREVLEKMDLGVHLHVVADGCQAMEFMRQPASDQIDVVILDLNLPRKSGREVLLEMSSDPILRSLPVAILTTSSEEDDILLQHVKEKCLFFSKTPDIHALMTIVSDIHAFAQAN